jgi:hypothetical protein
MGVVKYSFKVEKKISLHMIIVAAHGIVKATWDNSKLKCIGRLSISNEKPP